MPKHSGGAAAVGRENVRSAVYGTRSCTTPILSLVKALNRRLSERVLEVLSNVVEIPFQAET